MAPILPEQLLAAWEPATRVVKLAAQLEHAGVATVALPPAEKVPTPQIVQVAPPYPGGQTVRSVERKEG